MKRKYENEDEEFYLEIIEVNERNLKQKENEYSTLTEELAYLEFMSVKEIPDKYKMIKDLENKIESLLNEIKNLSDIVIDVKKQYLKIF
jgi:hypothetical protein